MKKTEKGCEYLENSPEAEARGLRRITQPKFWIIYRKTQVCATAKVASRSLLSQILLGILKLAEQNDKGYQTLIDQTLCNAIETGKPILSEVKNNLLKDKRFLEELKTVLAI